MNRKLVKIICIFIPSRKMRHKLRELNEISLSKKKVKPKPNPVSFRSYSQTGEDMILKLLIQNSNILNKPIKEVIYIDIGAHHPYFLSNTAFMYKEGAKGINIEANPALITPFNKHRKRDINLNIGISDRNADLDFHIINPNYLSTFDAKEAQHVENKGFKVVKIQKIPTITYSNLLKKYNNNIAPDFLNLDIEGCENFVLDEINKSKKYPSIICIETIDFDNRLNMKQKNKTLIKKIEKMGYFAFADTFINTIFVKKELI